MPHKKDNPWHDHDGKWPLSASAQKLQEEQRGKPDPEPPTHNRGPVWAIFTLVFLAAFLPLLAHVLWVIGQWSWNLIG